MLCAEKIMVAVASGEEQRIIFSGFDLRVDRHEVVFVVGPSGSGKSLFLRSLATLDPLTDGRLLLDGKTPRELGVPAWRARVCYVSQARWAFPGSPEETFQQAQGFAAQRGRRHGDLAEHASAMGLEQSVLSQAWSTLSGGQAQRAQLAIAMALRPDLLLLDEPTACLDVDTVALVEAHVKTTQCAIVWVSHDPGQPARVGGRVVQFPLAGGGVMVDAENTV